jgi:hypothetical protein
MQEAERTHHICLFEFKGDFDATINMAFCSEMNNTINVVALHDIKNQLKITDICF